jgi:hypothetical protein
MKKFHIILIVLFGFMMPNRFACGNSNSGSCTMEMSSKTNKKDCCQRTLILKQKAQRLQWKMWKGLVCAPSVNTAIPHYNQFEIKSSNFNFSSENKSFINPYPSLLLDMLPSGLFLK